MSIDFQIENERLLEKAREQGLEIRSFSDWKSCGKWVRKGERQTSVRVTNGQRRFTDPITGEDYYETKYALAYGFMANQVQ
jgi:hypothetical protein